MSTTVYTKDQCTECGRAVARVNECLMCHVETLVIQTIKSRYNPDQIKAFAENFVDADLFACRKNESLDGVTRHIAADTVALCLAYGLNVKDVQRGIARRLDIEWKQAQSRTPEQTSDYMRRVSDWIGAMTKRITQLS